MVQGAQKSGPVLKVLAINGSPRVDGNTDILLQAALAPVRAAGHAVTEYRLNDMDITPCQDCGGCVTTGVCIVQDAMTGVYEAIRTADRIVLASPIFFFGLSAQAKAMIDRCQAFWCAKYLLKNTLPAGQHGRKGLLLLVGGMKKEDGMRCAGITARAFFRTVSVPAHEVLEFSGVDAKGEIMKHPTAQKDARAAGKLLVT